MKYRIRKERDGIEFEVEADKEEEIPESARMLFIMERTYLIENAKHLSGFLWIRDNKGDTISNVVTDSGEKVAISLLEKWPEAKGNSEIAMDTGLSSASVYDQLTGRRGDKGSWFTQDGESYILSEKGEKRVTALISEMYRENYQNDEN